MIITVCNTDSCSLALHLLPMRINRNIAPQTAETSWLCGCSQITSIIAGGNLCAWCWCLAWQSLWLWFSIIFLSGPQTICHFYPHRKVQQRTGRNTWEVPIEQHKDDAKKRNRQSYRMQMFDQNWSECDPAHWLCLTLPADLCSRIQLVSFSLLQSQVKQFIGILHWRPLDAANQANQVHPSTRLHRT